MKIGIVIKKVKALNRNIKATFSYILNLNKQGRKGHKVEYSGAENFLYDEIDKQIAEMVERHKRYRKYGGKVVPDMHIVLSYPTNFVMSEDEYRKDVKALLRHLGMENNACLWAVHSNTRNTHIHLYIDRIDPVSLEFETSKGTFFETTKSGTVRRHESNCFQAACYELSQKYGLSTSQYLVDDKGVPKKHIKSTNTRVNPKDKKGCALTEKANNIMQDFLLLHNTSWNSLLDEFALQGIEYKVISSKEGKARGAILIDKGNSYKIKSSALPIGHKELEKKLGAFPFIISPALTKSPRKKADNKHFEEVMKEKFKMYIEEASSWEEFNSMLDEYGYYMEQRGTSFAIVYDEYNSKKESIAPSKIDRSYSYTNLKKKWGNPPDGMFRKFEHVPKEQASNKKAKNIYSDTSQSEQKDFYISSNIPQVEIISNTLLVEKVKSSFNIKSIVQNPKSITIEFEEGYTLKIKPDKIILTTYKNEEELISAIHSMIEIGIAKGWKLEDIVFTGSEKFKEKAYGILDKMILEKQEATELIALDKEVSEFDTFIETDDDDDNIDIDL